MGFVDINETIREGWDSRCRKDTAGGCMNYNFGFFKVSCSDSVHCTK